MSLSRTSRFLRIAMGCHAPGSRSRTLTRLVSVRRRGGLALAVMLRPRTRLMKVPVRVNEFFLTGRWAGSGVKTGSTSTGTCRGRRPAGRWRRSAVQSGDDPGDLVGADRRGRVEALRLAKDDERGVVCWRADVESADEIDAAVAGRAGEPTLVVARAGTAKDLCADLGSELLEGVLAPVKERIETFE
jgi:hypothetical protein